MRVLIPLLGAALLSGCATSYQTQGLTGGLLDDHQVGKLETVVFSANGYTSGELAQTYALYRCAELAKQHNKPFFIMYNSLLAAAYGRPSRAARVGAAQGKPTATAFVLLLDAPAPGARNTQEVIDDLQKVINTGTIEKG
jgi:hypothetical protein